MLFAEPYMRMGQLALIRKAEIGQFGHPASLRRRGARVGFVRGTTGAAFVERSLRRADTALAITPDLELLAGDALYDTDGTTLWDSPLLEGYSAVANFDADPELAVSALATMDLWPLRTKPSPSARAVVVTSCRSKRACSSA